MVINPFVNEGHTCATLEYCPSKLSGDDVYDLLMSNFKRHYLKNRAPFGVHLSSTWLRNNEYLIAFKNRRFEEAEIACAKPNTCKLPSRVLEHDKYMITCMDCPKSYPWLRNEFGYE
ncbi:Uncharacterized protein OBRU01_16717 [Operophtera brumata]|uniref:Uncharacterized protein n=1 Tax=Operophtera brumata TaxID=104452 RepID=A0A0L7L1V1_OPEBR|nr:Uncharacterized protein OBRU01_16717 [Operophtera brumata]